MILDPAPGSGTDQVGYTSQAGSNLNCTCIPYMYIQMYLYYIG